MTRFWSPPGSPILAFRVVVAALMASTAFGVWYGAANRGAIVSAFPGAANSMVYAGLLGTGGAGLVALAGLWRWRRWAVALYGIVALAGVVLDVLARAPALHQATVVTAAVLLFLLVYLNRQRFRNPSGTAG